MSSKSKAKAPAVKKRKRSNSDDDRSLSPSDGFSSDADDPPLSTSDAELSEAHRLKSLAYTKGLISPSTSSASPSTSLPIPPSLFPYSNADIENKSQSRANPRFLCVFPGQFHLLPHIQAAIKAQHTEIKAQAKATASSPTSSSTPPSPPDPSIIGRVGSIQSLDSRNPLLTLDFPQGQLVLKGTLVYPEQVRVMALQYQTRVGKKVKALQCRGTFDHFIVFSDWTWKGRGEGEEGKDAIPPEVLTGPVGLGPTGEDVGMESSEEGDLAQVLSEEEGEDEVEEEKEREDEAVDLGEGGDDDVVVVVSDDEELPRHSAKARTGVKVKRRRVSDEEESSEEGEAWKGGVRDEDEPSSAVQRPRRSSGKVNYAVDVTGSDADEDDADNEDGPGEEEEVESEDDRRGGSGRQSKGRAKDTAVRRKVDREEDEEEGDEEEEDDGGDDNDSEYSG